MEKQYTDLLLEDKCLVHRYIYQYMNQPIIPNSEYDAMKKVALSRNINPNHPLKKKGIYNYPDHIKMIAHYKSSRSNYDEKNPSISAS